MCQGSFASATVMRAILWAVIWFGISNCVRARTSVIERFRKTCDLYIRIAILDLPPTRFEAKVEFVYVSLVGASAVAPVITCILEHAGQFSSKRRDGSEAQMTLQPKRASVLAAKTPQQYSGIISGQSSQEVNFWGRGVATGWHLTIEPLEVAQTQVDLFGLSEIQFGIGYQSFLQ